MNKEIKDILTTIDKAFSYPVYNGDISKPVLKKDSLQFFLKSRKLILSDRSTKEYEALKYYWLGILSRYINVVNNQRNGFNLKNIFFSKSFKKENQEDFFQCMMMAIKTDPEFFEAKIALSEGNKYRDPYYYPDYEDLRTGKVNFKDKITYSKKNTGSIELIRYNYSIIPAVVIKHSTSQIRSQLNDDTHASIIISIDAVPPSLPAVMHVLPVVFDDFDDPLWQNMYLNLFPISQEINGIHIIQHEDLPISGLNTAFRLCRESKCAIFVLDLYNNILLSKIVNSQPASNITLDEMSHVLQIIGESNIKINYLTFANFIDIHDKKYVIETKNPKGKLIRIPSNRDIGESIKYVCHVKAYDDRLTISNSLKSSKNIDIFISHAHFDQELVNNINKWLLNIWPSLKIYCSRPEDRIPLFQFVYEASSKSKCVLYIATPVSIQRPMVGIELSGNKSIITVLAQTSYNDIKHIRDKDLYCKIDMEKIVDIYDKNGWETLAKMIAKVLGLNLPNNIPKGPWINNATMPSHNIKKLNEDFTKLYVEFVTNFGMGKKQTRVEAEQLLYLVEEELIKLGEKDGTVISRRMLPQLNTENRLLVIALIIPDKKIMEEFFNMFPALIDNKLLLTLKHTMNRLNSSNSQDSYEKEQIKIEIKQTNLAIEIVENIIKNKNNN